MLFYYCKKGNLEALLVFYVDRIFFKELKSFDKLTYI